MTYAICTQPLSPRLDTLPTYKIIDYPLEKRDYKPFAQTKLCTTPEGLILHMWAFEMVPKKESKLQVVFTTKNSQTLLFAECCSDGKLDCYTLTPQSKIPQSVISHTIKGEDLQGDFWGIGITFPQALLQGIFGDDVLVLGNTLMGNVYKLSDNPDKPHKGSLHPADFAGNKEYALSSLAEFKIVRF